MRHALGDREPDVADTASETNKETKKKAPPEGEGQVKVEEKNMTDIDAGRNENKRPTHNITARSRGDRSASAFPIPSRISSRRAEYSGHSPFPAGTLSKSSAT